jgi:hypothetical protein
MQPPRNIKLTIVSFMLRGGWCDEEWCGVVCVMKNGVVCVMKDCVVCA